MEYLGKKTFSKEALDNWHRHFNRLKTYYEQQAEKELPDVEFADEELARWTAIQRNIKNELPAELKNKLLAINFDFEEKHNSWEHRYQQLTAFVNKNGHSYLPANDLKYERLRDWLLRQVLDKKFLSEDQTQKLDALGVDWNMITIREHRWEIMYAKLKNFNKVFGHCRVPQNWATDKKLANWVGVQRRTYAAGKMKKERMRKLNELGFIWNIKDVFENQWEDFYQQLKAFHQEHGHCKVPGKLKKLASWVDRQRTLRKKDLMQAERKKRLDEINFIWDFKDINEQHWKTKYKQLCVFKSQYNHSFVPVNYKKDKSLGQWVALQRRLEVKGKLEKSKKKQLDRLGFVWSKDTERRMKEIYDEQWNDKFQKLKAYKKKYGTCQVSLKIDRVLQRWTRWQRILYEEGKLEEKRFVKLDKIEFPWSVNDGYWMKMFKALTHFYKEHGHVRVPFQWPPNPRLAAWIYRIKKNKQELSSKQVSLLDSIGFNWTINKRELVPWQEMYNRLLTFKLQFGHTRIPVKWPEDPKLGKWVSRMRYQRDNLNRERVRLLEKIDFDWGYRYVPQTAKKKEASSFEKAS